MITVIYVIPLWWIFFWVNICLRLQWFCFSYESRCILCTPFLCTCYDQACVWERVRGNVCISWSNGGWLVQWTWEKVLRSTLVSNSDYVQRHTDHGIVVLSIIGYFGQLVRGPHRLVRWTWEKVPRSTWVFTLLCCLTRDKEKYLATGDVGVTIATTPWLDLACSYFNFMSWYLMLRSDLS